MGFVWCMFYDSPIGIHTGLCTVILRPGSEPDFSPYQVHRIQSACLHTSFCLFSHRLPYFRPGRGPPKNSTRNITRISAAESPWSDLATSPAFPVWSVLSKSRCLYVLLHAVWSTVLRKPNVFICQQNCVFVITEVSPWQVSLLKSSYEEVKSCDLFHHIRKVTASAEGCGSTACVNVLVMSASSFRK